MMRAGKDALSECPVVLEFADRPIWGNWRYSTEGVKIPLRSGSGIQAKSNDPSTWTEAGPALQGVNGNRHLAVFLGDLGDGYRLLGVDWDNCRNPETDEIHPEALKSIAMFGSYCEVSPSGTGVKGLGLFEGTEEDLPDCFRRDGKTKGYDHHGVAWDIPGAVDRSKVKAHDHPHASIYPGSRYFAVTGQHVECAPDSIEDISETLPEFCYHHPPRKRDGRESAGEPEEIDDTLWPRPNDLTERAKVALENDQALHDLFHHGKKPRGDVSGSARDASLVTRALIAGCEREDVASLFWHFAHGQVANGKLKTVAAVSRMINRLIAKFKPEENAGTPGWLNLLKRTRQGPRKNVANVAIALRNAEELKDRLRFDELGQRIVSQGLPWRESQSQWTDVDSIYLAEWLQTRGFDISPNICADAALMVAHEAAFHPVRDYLDGLRWDGVNRLETLMTDYFGVVGSDDLAPYVREVGKRFMIAAAARVYKPGCKNDYVPILEGPQGSYKSSAIASLVPNSEWYADEIDDLRTKDAAQSLQGKWIIELSELAGVRRADVDKTKAFISRSSDHYRPRYGRTAKDHPRRCVFVGTTNRNTYLNDETGNRRYLPIRVGKIAIAKIKADRDQLWAEAAALLKAGEQWWIADSVLQIATAEQSARVDEDPWTSHVLTIAGQKYAQGVLVTVQSVHKWFEPEVEKRTQRDAQRIGKMLTKADWKPYRPNHEGRRVTAYLPPNWSGVVRTATPDTPDRPMSVVGDYVRGSDQRGNRNKPTRMLDASGVSGHSNKLN